MRNKALQSMGIPYSSIAKQYMQRGNPYSFLCTYSLARVI